MPYREQSVVREPEDDDVACGNDALNGLEECDDGNNVDGDGCTASCIAEY